MRKSEKRNVTFALDNTKRLTCKRCGEKDSVVILDNKGARKCGYNDTCRIISYGLCEHCQAVYQIYMPTGRYDFLKYSS